jgi:tetratricopeptide (TPR) repeat protein
MITTLGVLPVLAGLALLAGYPAPGPADASPAAAARAAYQAGDGARLEAAARDWIAAAPQEPEAALALGIARCWQQRPEEAIEPLRRRLVLLDDADGHGWLGHALTDAGEFAAGERELRVALASNPEAVPPRKWLADSLSFQGRFKEAEESAREALRLRPADLESQERVSQFGLEAAWRFPAPALAHYGRGTWLLSRRRFEPARAEFLAALELAPACADCRYQAGWAEDKLGHHAEAQALWRAAIEGYGPGETQFRGSAQYHLGYVLGLGSDKAERAAGVELLREALAHAMPWTKSGIAFALGQVCGAADDLACERDAYLEFLSSPLPPSTPDFSRPKAVETAEAALKGLGCAPGDQPPRFAASRCAPEQAVRLLAEALAAARAGKFDEARPRAASAVQLAPEYGQAHQVEGHLALQKEDFGAAERAFRAALAATTVPLGPEERASAKRLLALTLVKQERNPKEAVRLGLEGWDDTASDPAERAFLSVTLGRAFGLAGNAKCSARRLAQAIEVKEADERLKARARELLGALSASARENSGKCFEYEKYQEESLPALSRRLLDTPGHPYGAGTFRLVPIQFYRMTARAVGKRRPLSEPARFIVKEYVEHMDPEIGRRMEALYRTELQFTVDGQEWWLPVQEPLLESWDREVAAGAQVDLYLWFPGGVDQQLVFMVAEFETCR